MNCEIIDISKTGKNEKIEKVLQKFLEPDFKIRNDVYLNSFLTHLVGKDDSDKTLVVHTNEELKAQFFQWIIQASTLWDQQKVKPQTAILAFALNLASHLSSDEQIFVKLNCQNVYEGLVGVAQRNSKKDPNVTLGLVTLLCAFLEHKSGVQWVVATDYWADINKLGLKANTMYIRKKSYQFVTKLLQKTISLNRNFALNLTENLIKPLKYTIQTPPNDQKKQQTLIQNRELYESLKPTLEIVSKVVEELLLDFNTTLLDLFLELKIQEIIDRILLLSQNEDFSYALLEIQFVFIIYKLCIKFRGVKVVNYDSCKLADYKNLYNLIKKEMDKNNVKCVVKICSYAHRLFCLLESRIPVCSWRANTVECQMQMIGLQLTPVYSFGYQLTGDKVQVQKSDDVFRNDHVHRWLKVCSVDSIGLCYKWLDVLREKSDLVEDAILSLQYVLKMKKLLNKDRCSTIFSGLVYALCDALTHIKENCHSELGPRYTLYLGTLIETLVELVESFGLTWNDSIETICVLGLAYDFLQVPHLPNDIIILKCLKLLNISISKYMSPDMALLIYKEDSKITHTGKLLYAKCHDSSWEIRDSALEVVCTLSHNAKSKFPEYTSILLKEQFPQLVISMALKDGEYYVRATAFKCLQELIQIPDIWNELLAIDKFLDSMLDVFQNETEGVVRKEAAALIYKISKFQTFPEDILPRLYNVMTHAAIGDLHWEVKYNALDFWFDIVEQHLITQGMIDRGFPSHTFSKELKKIVTLNDTEVRKRIIRVLNELSHVGCLHVIKCAIQDDCDIEVSKKATDFTFQLMKLFKIYKVPCENIDLVKSPSQTKLTNGEVSNKNISLPTASFDSLGNMSPASITNLSVSQLPSPSFFDPFSPLSMPYSPSLDLDLLTPTDSTKSSPAQGSEIVHQQEDFNITDQSTASTENTVNPSRFDSIQTEMALEEFLNSNDITLLQEIYNPTDHVRNNTTQMKTKAFLLPSQYLKFVYNEVETYATEKKQWLNSLDEFDSLLDDILKEYNIVGDVNSMDCY